MSEAIYQIDQPRSGVENMALDQSMLQQTAHDGVTRLRFYRWSMPTVSLGYFQKFTDYKLYLQQLQLSEADSPKVVRRATGGGAIVHHHDWTYSIAMPAEKARAVGHGPSTSLYDSAHQALITWLRTLAIESQLWTPKPDLGKACEPNGCAFLCFERRHSGDVVLDDCKIMGSAQRRLESAILQHGSLLLAKSPFAGSLPGLADLRLDVSHGLIGFAGQVVQRISADFGIEFQCCDWPDPIVPISNEARLRFENSTWTARI